MTRKYIETILTAGFKYFFDLDYTAMIHSLTIVLVAAGFIKLCMMWLRNEFFSGIQTVKEDAREIKGHFSKIVVRLDAKEQMFYGYIRNLKASNEHSHDRLAS